MAERVTIVDYGMGNLWSVTSAFKYLGAKYVISSDPDTVRQADTLLLPGVGSFRRAMETLNSSGLAVALREAVQTRRSKILGICLGMQLFAEAGTEDGNCDGLGFIPGRVERFSADELDGLKVPHIGFNHVHAAPASKLFAGLPADSDFYFVHSFRLLNNGLPGKAGMCRYGIDFVAAYEYENVFAAQFHPEKSQTNGLLLLKNFLKS